MPLVETLHFQTASATEPGASQDMLELSSLAAVRTVDFYGGDFRSLPEGVLRMRQLESVFLVSAPNLKALPEDLGCRLPRLRYLFLHGCEVAIPRSVWDALERNARPGKPSVSVIDQTGVVQLPEAFPALDREAHPRICAKLESFG